MKKIALLFIVFLFFGFLSAEDVKTGKYDFGDVTVTLFEERKTEPEPEPEKAEEEPEPEQKPAGLLEDKMKEPKSFYIQPMVTAGIFAGGYDEIVYGVIGTDVDFASHLAGTREGHNIYLGFNLGVKYSNSLYRTVEIPVQSKIVFDFKTNSPYGTPEYASLWLSLGLCAGRYDEIYIVGGDPDEEVDPEWSMNASWGIGTDLTFANGIVLQFAVKSFATILPIPSLGFGYRF